MKTNVTLIFLQVLVGQKALQNTVCPNAFILAHRGQQGQLGDPVLMELIVCELDTSRRQLHFN